MVRVPNAEAGDVASASPRESDASAVHAQMAKILGSPHFRNSKRSQALLKYVVESALAGETSLKERCVGAAVFGREMNYDTAQDPIVRNAAIEVRKRLAQYYLEPEHTTQLRIDLPIGTYLPLFTVETPTPVVEPPAKLDTPRRPFAIQKWMLATAGIVLASAAALAWWSARRTPLSELEAFWEPMFRDQQTVQVCIGQPTRLYRFTGPRAEDLNRLLGNGKPREGEAASLSVASSELSWVAPEYMYMRDALSAFNVASWIQSKGRAYRLMSVANTNYSQLRRTPLVVIGAFNNAWAMRVNAELRFVFDRRTLNGSGYNCIIDRRQPDVINWKVQQPPGGGMPEDFAIVTKVFDAATEKTVITAAGIESFGTLAASEFVTQPEYLGAALASVPADRRQKNVQFVLGTKIIDGTPGPPRVLAAHYW